MSPVLGDEASRMSRGNQFSSMKKLVPNISFLHQHASFTRFVMEELQISSVVISNSPAPVSDSESSIHQYLVEYATPNNEAPALKPGVMMQRNGHWGAYLCANGEHVWLGSFESEDEATSMAHKGASIQFCDADSNKPQLQDSSHATEFPNILRAQVQEKPDPATLRHSLGFNLRLLFTKVLTPSDVGKLNRLVIPKRYAVRYFPPISEDEGLTEDVEVMFFDMSMKSWKFRYCYWKSSQSYVLTRGWYKFSKEKGLKPKDMVIFSAYERNDDLDELGKPYIVDVSYDNGVGDHQIPDVADDGEYFSPEFEMGQTGDGDHENKEI